MQIRLDGQLIRSSSSNQLKKAKESFLIRIGPMLLNRKTSLICSL